MKPFAQLVRSKTYWVSHLQNKLFATVERFRRARGWKQQHLAEHLGYSKGYMSQIMNGDFDHRLSKLVELSLAVGMVPDIQFRPIDEYVADYLRGQHERGGDAAYATTTFAVNTSTIRQESAAEKLLVDMPVVGIPGAMMWQPNQKAPAYA